MQRSRHNNRHIVQSYPKIFYDTFCIGSIIFVGIEIFDIALFLQHLLYFRFLGYTKTLFLLSVILRYADFTKTQYVPYCQSLFLCKLSLYDTVCGKKVLELRRVLMRTVFPLKTQKSVAFCRERHTRLVSNKQKQRSPPKKKPNVLCHIWKSTPHI